MPDTTSRLFGSAMAGVKKPQPKLVPRASGSQAAPDATARAKNGSASQGNNGARGRGAAVFSPTPTKASGPVRQQKTLRRATHYREDADATAQRYMQFPRPDPHKEAEWHHDQYTGPLPIGSSVFVRSLPKGASEPMVSALFSRIGEVVSVQMDDGPLPTATIGFVRQDTAFTAAERFHGYLLQGEQLKVSVREASKMTTSRSLEDDDFWRQELRQMPKRQPVELAARGHLDRDEALSRGALVDDDDDFWRRELADMNMQRRRSRSRQRGGEEPRQSFAPPARAHDDDNFWRQELAEMKTRRRPGATKNGSVVRRGRGTFVAKHGRVSVFEPGYRHS